MDRAGQLLAGWKTARTVLTPEAMVQAAWPAAVGRRLADRTRAVGMVRTRLVVEVEDAIWQRNLHTLREQILQNLTKVLGTQAPRDIEFRIGVPRRPPQMQAAPAVAKETDEADGIADPVLGRLYRASRRKATA